MRNLVPSPLRSTWAFIGYVLIFVVPLWRLISFLGDVNFVMGYVGPVGNVLATGWGTALLIIVGFGCLIYANYRQRSALSTPTEASAPTEKQVPATDSEELRAARERLERAVYQGKQENDSLRKRVQELETMSPEEYRARQEDRRKRIAKWRTGIENGNFQRAPLDGSHFTATNTYQDMKPWLLDHARDRLENSLRTQVLFDLARKKPIPSDKDVLLGEVSRIEKEWGLI